MSLGVLITKVGFPLKNLGAKAQNNLDPGVRTEIWRTALGLPTKLRTQRNNFLKTQEHRIRLI